MKGIMQYNIALSKYEFNINDYSYLFRGSSTKTELFITHYSGYNINIIRFTSTHSDGKTSYRSKVKISKGYSELVNSYDDGVDISLWFEQQSTRNPIQVENKLMLKAMAIIDRLDENSSARLYLCNRGNIVEIDNLPQDIKEYYGLVAEMA